MLALSNQACCLCNFFYNKHHLFMKHSWFHLYNITFEFCKCSLQTMLRIILGSLTLFLLFLVKKPTNHHYFKLSWPFNHLGRQLQPQTINDFSSLKLHYRQTSRLVVDPCFEARCHHARPPPPWWTPFKSN